MMRMHVAQAFTVRLVVGWLAALALTLMSPGPATAQGVTKITQCPYIITVSGQYLVTQDLVCPDGIQIRASNVKLNVDGHTIDGLGLGHEGIDVQDATNVEIRNGTVTGYTVCNGGGGGISFLRASESRVEAMTLTGNCNGLELNQSNDNTVSSSTMEGNVAGGVALFLANGNVFRGNKVRNNGVGFPFGEGYFLQNSSNNLITSSNISNSIIPGNQTIGVRMRASLNNTVQSSQVFGNLVDGILLIESSNNNTVKSNTVKENGRGIVVGVGATANLIVSNTARENTGFDLEDDNFIPPCDANVWRQNNFTTANQPQCID